MDSSSPESGNTGSEPGSGREKLLFYGKIAGAIVALGGLIYQGTATHYQGDSLHKEAEQQRKQQAIELDLEPASDFTLKNRTVRVTNRSAEPVYQLRLYIAFNKSRGDLKHGDIAFFTFGVLSPCTQVKINLTDIAGFFPKTKDDLEKIATIDYGAMFVDATGQGFHRHGAGAINRHAWLEYANDGGDAPKLPPVFAHYKEWTVKPPQGIFAVLTAGVKTTQRAVVGTPTKAGLCTNQ